MITYSCDRCGIEISGHNTVRIYVANDRGALLHFCPSCRDKFISILEKYIPDLFTEDAVVV